MQTFAHQSVLAMHNARLFQELVDRGRQLEVANAHRTQFFANMSHELRTPLNAVLGYSELLYDGLYGALPERAVGVLDRIQANSKHLLGLINDVLDMTKMEAGALSLSLNDYSVKGLVDGVFASTESLAKTKGLAFEVVVPEGLPVGYGDDRRLTQVLLNLVGNAIKFTDEGFVRIEASLVDGFFKIAVRDTGPGISPEAQQRIFDEFHQIDDASTRRKGGTGLGLSISRRLVAMHGGRIDVESIVGQGATFTVVVPSRVSEQRPAA
jgi:signal transduction histidine kinase